MWGSASNSSGVLLSCPVISLASHITIILISTLKHTILSHGAALQTRFSHCHKSSIPVIRGGHKLQDRGRAVHLVFRVGAAGEQEDHQGRRWAQGVSLRLYLSLFLFFTFQQPLSCPAFYPAHLIPSRNLTYTQRYFNRYGRVKSAMHWMAVKGAHWRTPYGSLDKSVRQLGLLEHPAVHVSYKDAEEYCHWATGTTDNDDLALGDSKSDSKNSKSKDKKKRDILRLPTEWEWEYAARGGLVNSTFPWGDEAPSWGETGKRANTMNIWHERDWDESSSSSSSSRGNKGNKFGKSNDWEKDGYNFTAPAKYVMLRDACKFYSLLLFTHVCDSFLCLIYRGTISLSIYPSPQIHTHTCSNKLHPSPTSTPPATIHQILCPQRSRDIPDMWECVGMGTWRHAREAYVTRRQFCGFLRRPVRESSLRGYISIWLICVLPSSSLLQSLDLALSSISFVLAHRISIILIKSNLFHE